MQRILLFNQDEYNKKLNNSNHAYIHYDSNNNNNNNRQVFPSENNIINQDHNNIDISPT